LSGGWFGSVTTNGAWRTPRKLGPTLCPEMLTKFGKSKSASPSCWATSDPNPG
jgi:hypothetical protein